MNIAAFCIVNSYTLVANNIRHFKDISGLIKGAEFYQESDPQKILTGAKDFFDGAY